MIFISDCCRKWLGFFAWSVLLALSMLGGGCKPGSSTADAATKEVVVDTLPDDFVTFYDRFHDDSAYQMEHIIFPLEGLPNSTGDSDTLTSARYFWQRDSWKKHNRFTDPGGNFEQWYEVSDAGLIEHWIQMKGTNLYMRRRFAKLDHEWFLIYYQGMRPMDR